MSIKKIFPLLALYCFSAQAHQIWIEPAGKAYALHFGEYDENLKETSPGLLDKMPVPSVSRVTGADAVSVAASKGKDGYALDAKAAGDDSLVAEVRSYPLFERKNGDQVTRGKWVPAARYINSFAAREPRNILDIVPLGNGGKFRLSLRGQPLPKTKLTLVAPNGWQKPLQSDDKGEFEIATLWQGLYVIEVSHKEAVAGELDGEKYDSISFTTTLSFTQPKGAKTPRPELAKPNAMH